MQLVERHRIDRHDARFVAIDAAAFASKNLYNAALYITRQAFIFEGKRIAYEALARQLQGTERYRTLPAKVAQWVLKQVTRAWDSFFLALTAWKADPASFLGRPRFPKYLDKNGRNLLIYTIQAISCRRYAAASSNLPVCPFVSKQTKRRYAKYASSPAAHIT